MSRQIRLTWKAVKSVLAIVELAISFKLAQSMYVHNNTYSDSESDGVLVRVKFILLVFEKVY